MGVIMKKIIGWILLIIIAVGSIYIVKDKRKIYEGISTNNSEVEIKIRYKGLKRAVDFTMNDNNIYIGFKDKILCIPYKGEPYKLIDDNTLNITSLELCNENLYFISNNKLMSVHILSREVQCCIDNLPNKGDYSEILLKAHENKLYLTLGAATNSGVVGSDNGWTKEKQDFHDIPAYDIKMKENTSGAFVSRNTGNTENQVIKGEKISTASILEYNTGTTEITTYAWGIRSVKGIDINSEGRIFATVGGYENRGERPVEGDCDYIYEIKKDMWYGFPDYSGGDPLTSPRFKSNGAESLSNILSEHPMNPPAPIYQHESLNSLSYLAIDNGNILNLQGNSIIYCFDSLKNEVFYSSIGGAPEELIKFKDGTGIKKMKALNDALYFLDSENGFLFTLGMKN